MVRTLRSLSLAMMHQNARNNSRVAAIVSPRAQIIGIMSVPERKSFWLAISTIRAFTTLAIWMETNQ